MASDATEYRWFPLPVCHHAKKAMMAKMVDEDRMMEIPEAR
jgi:hypothetical protein